MQAKKEKTLYGIFFVNFVTSMALSLNLTMFYQVRLTGSVEIPKGSGSRPYAC